MIFSRKYTFLLNGLLCVFCLFPFDGEAQKKTTKKANPTKKQVAKPDSLLLVELDTLIEKTGRRPAYRWKDSPVGVSVRSPLLFKDPKTVRTMGLDPSGRVNTSEKIANQFNYRFPQSMSFKDYANLQNKRVANSLWREYAAQQDGKSAFSGRGLRPNIEKSGLVDRIFGGDFTDFKPNGFVTLDFALFSQFIDNPAIPINQRKTTNIDFNEQININFNGKIGENLGMLTNFDTKSAFNFQNKLKLNYQPKADVLKKGLGIEKPNIDPSIDRIKGIGNEVKGIENEVRGMGDGIKNDINSVASQLNADNLKSKIPTSYSSQSPNILQKLDAGHVSLPLNSQLIPGVQNLFGVKAQMRFGKLDVTTVMANQQSKGESFSIKGGKQNRAFEIPIAQYDENKHFFLSQYFRENYERSLKSLPVIMSGVTITRVEVYVTNRTNSYETMRNLAAFTDLGEGKPYNKTLNGISQNPADNASNVLYAKLQNDKSFRQIDQSNNSLLALGLKKAEDYEVLRGAKRLTERDFRFHPELGYISLNTALRNDEVLAVAFEYTYNGRKYKVGELTEDYAILKDDEAIVLKLLKSSTIRNRLDLPMWNLMMKNVYSLNTSQINKLGFQLRIIYKDDQTGIDNPNLQEGRKLKDEPLIRVLNLDRLNSQNDPQPDGNFDFVEGITVDSRNGKIIFPVLEPFGSYLNKFFDVDEIALKEKYVFNELYRTTLKDAEQITSKTKFFIRGSLQSSSGSEIQMPPGVTSASVRLSSGGVPLVEGQDYTVEEQSGRVKITNQSILNSGRQIDVNIEKPDMFNNQIRRMLGTRLDYNLSKDVHLGMTAMGLRERTINTTTRVAVGNEPVNNTIVGFDAAVKKNSRFLTQMLDKLPLIQTKEISSIQFQGEIAKLFPNVSPQVNGNAMIDDFESTRNTYNLANQPTRWRLGATPEDPLYKFQGAYSKSKPYEYNYRRAKMSVYNIDQTFFGTAGFDNLRPQTITAADLENHYERSVYPQEIFSNRSVAVAGLNLPSAVLDISYFPSERGMYNYNTDLFEDGRLKNPRKNFGAITRAITSDIDFDNANVEYVDFWLMDPFVAGVNGVIKDGFANPKNNTTGGKMLFHLGDSSEDVIPDGQSNFENGLPFIEPISDNDKKDPVKLKTYQDNLRALLKKTTDSTAWGRSPKRQFIIDAFTNQDGSRQQQDVGLDGLANADEQVFFSKYLNDVSTKLNAEAFQKIKADPSGDDFEFAFSEAADKENRKIVARHKNYLGMENNSPTSTNNAANDNPLLATAASSVQPDKEDVNADNTINDTESYYEYEINLRPNALNVGTGYVVDKVTANGVSWYQFRVPIKSFARSFGDIQGFKSIRFMRVVLTDFEQPVVLRFAQMQLTANQYRVYNKDLNKKGLVEVPEPYDAQFKVATVSIEENGTPDPNKTSQSIYVLPPGVTRDRDISQQNLVEFNEQSLSLCVSNLRDGDSRAVFKNTRLDLQNYKRLRMFVHQENINNTNHDQKAGVFIRLGTDNTENYYEIELPKLKSTAARSVIDTDIWPEENFVDIAFDDLRSIKSNRNKSKLGFSKPYSEDIEKGKFKVTVVGNPDLSAILTIMLGVRNPKSADEEALSFCVWLNELRANGFNQQSGWAAVGSANVKLADLAQVVISGSKKTFGFGGVQQKISERERQDTQNLGFVANISLDKLTPEKWGLRVPLFVNYENETIAPHYNPLDPDMDLDKKLEEFDDPVQKQKYKKLVEERSTKKGFNLSNVRKVKTKEDAKNHFYDVENVSATYAYTNQERTNILLDQQTANTYRGGLAYSYTPEPQNIEPFKNIQAFDKPWLYFLKDFNFSPIPSVVAIQGNFDRSYAKTQLRNSDLTTTGIAPTFEKYFLMNRQYDLQWNLAKSVLINYGATMNAIVDEPYGEINEYNRDSLRNSLLRLGRAKNFDQKLTGTYRLPLDKFQALDWISADARFASTYNFNAASFNIKDTLDVPFGNIIKNSKELGVQGRVDFIKVYNKIKNLRLAQQPNIARKNIARNPGDDEDIEAPPSNTKKSILRVLTLIRGINYNYSKVQTTVLPGFVKNPRFFGVDADYNTGDFIDFALLGNQNKNIHYIAAENNLLSRSTIQNQAFVQTINQKFDYSTNLEPINGLKINIRGNLLRGDAYQEFYRPETANGSFVTQTPVRTGNLSMSFWSFKTAFAKNRADNTSALFDVLQANIPIINQRLAVANKGTKGEYSNSSQDVLIPAFFAAYSGRDATATPLTKLDPFNPSTFLSIPVPLPNWDLNYTSLANLAIFKPYFSSITLTHRYSSTYSVGNFTSSLDYAAAYVNAAVSNYPTAYPMASLANTNGQFIPVFVMSTITMQERFAPMIGVQFTTKGKMTGRVEYNQDRNIALNLANQNIAELSNKDLTVNIAYKKNNFKLPFRMNGETITLKNDLNFSFQLTIRDSRSVLRKLSSGESEITAGNYNFQLKPSIQYMVNKAMQVDFYLDKMINNPFVTNSYLRKTTQGGIRVKFNLAELL